MVAPAVLFGLAQGGLGIASAFDKFNQQSAQARAVNQQRVQQYRNQLAIREFGWAKDRSVYAQKLGQYNQQLGENQLAYNRAVGDTQFGLNETFRQAQVGALQRGQTLASRQGVGAASGRTGSGLRSDQNIMGQYMQGQGMMMDNLLRARYGAQRQITGFRDQLMSANRQAFAQVANAPLQPIDVPKPIQQEGPSRMSLALGVGQGIMSGISAGVNPAGMGAADFNKAFGYNG